MRQINLDPSHLMLVVFGPELVHVKELLMYHKKCKFTSG